VGTTNLNAYAHPTPPAYLPEAKWGKWHRALLLAVGPERDRHRPGVIDGNGCSIHREERMRGPHTFVFVSCTNVTVRDVTSWTRQLRHFFQISDQVDIRNVKFLGGWDGVHWRGAPERWCHDVSIVGCQFYTGDDAIAGRYWRNTLIADCVINSSCTAFG